MEFDGITILCRVVDNFGDIGFSLRLSRALLRLRPALRLRLVTDNLDSLSLLCPSFRAGLPAQDDGNLRVLDWNCSDFCSAEFSARFPFLILECFQCGRPEWLDGILFAQEETRPCQIVNIDYLTAESYAEQFHGLLSLTRSARVKKTNFMPGFTPRTGGLILNGFPAEELRRNSGNTIEEKAEFRIFAFCYRKDLAPLADALERFAQSRAGTRLFAAGGQGLASVLEACANIEDPHFALEELPFVPQEEFDRSLFSYDFLLVRGEDSLARACLSGIPFLWHAYPQDDDYQLVKVEALLGRMRPHFDESGFSLLRDAWLEFNKGGSDSQKLRDSFYQFLAASEGMGASFREFARSIEANGCLAERLLEFLGNL